MECHGPWSVDVLPIAEAIHLALPLVPALRSIFGVRAWAVSAVLREECLAEVGALNVIRLVQLTEALAPEKAPKTPDEWMAALSVAQLFMDIPAGADSCRTWFCEASRGWEDFHARHFVTGMASHVVPKYGNALWNAAIAATGRPQSTALREAGVRRGLAEAMKAVKFSVVAESALRWYADWSVAIGGGKLSWEPIMNTPEFTWGGISICSLTQSIDLSMEGRAMRHCVGNLATACYLGESHIVSLREGARPVSTAELKIVTNCRQQRIRVVQHRGVDNGPPPPGAVTALQHFVEEASAPSQSPWIKFVERSALERRARFDPVFVEKAGELIYDHIPNSRTSFENSVKRSTDEVFDRWNDRFDRLYDGFTEEECWEVFWQTEAEREWRTKRAEAFLLSGCDRFAL